MALNILGRGGTRPISIVNTDNRLIANVYRFRLEPILDNIISPQQQGFLPGRSMISNVLSVEHQMAIQA